MNHLRLIRTHNKNSQTDRIFQIADVPFAQVSEEEKEIYAGRMAETGSDQGYKRRQYWVCPLTILTFHILMNLSCSILMVVYVTRSRITTVSGDGVVRGEPLC